MSNRINHYKPFSSEDIQSTVEGATRNIGRAIGWLTGGDANAKGGDSFQKAWEQGVQKQSLGERMFSVLKAPNDKLNELHRSEELVYIANKNPRVASAVMSVEANTKDLQELRAMKADWQARRDDPANVKDRKQLDKGIKSIEERIEAKRAEIEGAKDVIAKSNIPAAKNRVGALTTANEGRNHGSEWEEKAQNNFVSDAKAAAKVDQDKADLHKMTEKDLGEKIQNLQKDLSAPKDTPSAPNKGGDVYLSKAEMIGSKLGAIKDKILGAGLPRDVGQNHQEMIQKAQETSAKKAELAHAQQVLKDKLDTAAAVKTSREATDTIKEASTDKARLTKDMASASPEQKESMQKQIDKLDEKIKTAQGDRGKALGTIKAAHDRKEATMEKAAQSKAAVDKLEKTGDSSQYHKDMDKPQKAVRVALKEASSNERKAAFEAGLYNKSPEELSALKDKMDKASEGRTLSPEAEKRRETVSNVLDNQKQAAENKAAYDNVQTELAKVTEEVKNFEPLFTVNDEDAKKQDAHISGLKQKKADLGADLKQLNKDVEKDEQKRTDAIDRHVHAKDHLAQVEKHAGVDKGAEKVSQMEAQLNSLEKENAQVSQQIKDVKSGGIDSKIEALSQKLEEAMAENAKLKDELAEAKRQQVMGGAPKTDPQGDDEQNPATGGAAGGAPAGGGQGPAPAGTPKAETPDTVAAPVTEMPRTETGGSMESGDREKGGVVSDIVSSIDSSIKAAGEASTHDFVKNLTGVEPKAPVAAPDRQDRNLNGRNLSTTRRPEPEQPDRGKGAGVENSSTNQKATSRGR